MKHILLILVSACLGTSSLLAAEAHRFLYSDFMNRKLVYVDEADKKAYWEAFVPEICFDLTRTRDNRIYAAQRNGWREYNFTQRKLVRIVEQPAHMKNITSACEGPDGLLYVLEQKGDVHAFTREGSYQYTFTFPSVVRHGRALRFTQQGTALLGIDDGVAEVKLDRALTPEQRLVRTFTLPGSRSAYQGEYRADGTLLVTGGYLPVLATFAADGRLLKKIKANQQNDLHDYFYAGFQVRANGNVVLANWTGHNGRDFVPGWKIIEFNPAGDVVWHWNAPWAGTPNAVILFE